MRDLGRRRLRSDESPYGDVMSPYGRYEWLTPRDESPDGDVKKSLGKKRHGLIAQQVRARA